MIVSSDNPLAFISVKGEDICALEWILVDVFLIDGKFAIRPFRSEYQQLFFIGQMSR